MLRGAGRDRHEALAKRKLLGFAAAGGANSQFASKTVPPPPPRRPASRCDSKAQGPGRALHRFSGPYIISCSAGTRLGPGAPLCVDVN